MSAHVNGTASKNDLKQVKQYLENIDPEKVEKTYGRGKYTSWHGDGKSQSKTNITFQTKSIYTSGQPPKYITIVALTRRTKAYVTYESSTWSETTKTIIDEMIKAIEAKPSKDREVTTGPVIMPVETTQRSGQESIQVTICPRVQSGHPRSDFGVNLGEPSRLISKEVGEHPDIVELHAGENKDGEATTGSLTIPMEPSQGSGQESTQMTIGPGLQSGHPRPDFGVNLGEPSRLISKEVGEHPDIMELHAGEVRHGKMV